MIAIEYSPDNLLTGILRATIQIIRALSMEVDILLVVNLEHPHYNIPQYCKVKHLPRNSIRSDFDEDLVKELEALSVSEIPREQIQNGTIFFPRWRPQHKFFAKEIGIIYDCSPIKRVEDFSDSNTEFFLKHLKNSAKFNDLTFTISNFTHQEVLDRGLFIPDKLLMIYPGPSFNPVKLRETSEFKSPVKNINKYCLFVGSLDPRKGIFELLSWWTANQQRMEYENLILIGSVPDWSTQGHKNKIEKELSRAASVIHLGRLPDSEVFKFITGASLCIYPSKYEGFGLPVCDALFAGLKVVTSNQTSTLEFKDAGAIMIDPRKPWRWNKSIESHDTKPWPFQSLMDSYNWSNYIQAILRV